MNMIEMYKKQDCCGCSACEQICPKQCISMTEDTEGFLYPKVNKNYCVRCGLCEGVCPIIHKQTQLDRVDQIAYLAYANNEEMRLSSSSGGIFTILAELVLSDGGVVFGAAFDDDFMVHHIAVDTKEELPKLRGSKYLQSRIENNYAKAKHYLDAGQKVLFSGTACQIAGLKSYLRKEYDNLLTVDVLCHGVPSPKVWKKYLEEQKKMGGTSIKNIFFRNKETGWKEYSVTVEFEDHSKYKNVFMKDAFMRLFLADICLRPSCHNCRFKEFPRLSDITLGDCWGVEAHSPEMDDNKGTSVVIINTQKGNKVKEMICMCCVWKKGALNTFLPVTSDSRKSVSAHPNRCKFFAVLNAGKGIHELLRLIKPTFLVKVQNKVWQIKVKILNRVIYKN